MTIDICGTEIFEQEVSIGFKLQGKEFFVVKKEDQFFGYLNQCPHLGTSLEFAANKFMDIDNKFIQCSMHGALFRAETGECIHGPCVGEKLEPVSLKVKNGRIYAVL